MGVLNENDGSTYFSILGELLLGLSFTMGLSRLPVFSHYQLAFSGSKEGHTDIPRNTLSFSWLRKTIYQKQNIFWLTALNLKDIPHKGDSHETLDRIHVKYVLSKGAFMSKTVSTFVQKVGFIWSSIEHGSTSTLFNFMALLAL